MDADVVDLKLIGMSRVIMMNKELTMASTVSKVVSHL